MEQISIVAGGAGFIGSNLINHLLNEGKIVVVLDNFCRGQPEFLETSLQSFKNSLKVLSVDLSIEEDASNAFSTINSMGEICEVWHLAANSDIPAGISDSHIDLRDTFLTTFSLLEACKKYDVSAFHFASSSAVYGDHGNQALSENTGPLRPISNYGAMKLASEGAITAAQENFLTVANIFRFPNVVGVPATHGVISDFIHKLKATPEKLEVLGDGSQKKCYLHVDELIDAMLFIRQSCSSSSNIFNIGPKDDGVTVRQIAETVASQVSPDALIVYGRGSKGWVGDVPRFKYSTEKLKTLGWEPSLTSLQAVTTATSQILIETGL